MSVDGASFFILLNFSCGTFLEGCLTFYVGECVLFGSGLIKKESKNCGLDMNSLAAYCDLCNEY